MGKSLCVFFNRRYGNFLADLNGVVNNTGKSIDGRADKADLNLEIVSVNVDLVVPRAADDLFGAVVNLNGDISVIVGEFYVVDAIFDGNAGKLIDSVLDVAESADRAADGALRAALLRAVSLRIDVK